MRSSPAAVPRKQAVSDRYELRVARAAARALQAGPPTGLPLHAAEAIGAFLTGPLLDQPYRVGKELVNEWTGYHGARRGDYRVIYEIIESERVVRVVRIDHRSHAYRRG